ncbi:hypothetical protein CDAR_23571 [Caerostris darwini]|uniref:Uncharacterized protein n=1 Tax=Caerostris darwini TaxID=1538125 RepID=A0AAV4S7D5_9ARAC|nr:hypothetical protein CDAR_23571 [Caerostris darwini]
MDGLKLPMEKKIHHGVPRFLYWVKREKEDDNEEEVEDRMVEVGGGFLFRKRVRYGRFRTIGRLSLLRLWNWSRSFGWLSLLARQQRSVLVLFWRLLQWNEDLGFQIRREFADDNRYEFIALFLSLSQTGSFQQNGRRFNARKEGLRMNWV